MDGTPDDEAPGYPVRVPKGKSTAAAVSATSLATLYPQIDGAPAGL